MATRRVGASDRFGNPVDPTVGYARGRILRGTDEEVAKTLWARRLVRDRIAAARPKAIFHLTGMNRGCPLEPEDLPALRSHVPFFARLEGALAGHRRRPRLVPVEANTVIALSMLRDHGILTILAVAMPGSAPVVRLMMFPDGGRLGLERLEAALVQGLDRLSQVLDDLEAARPLILGK